MSLQAKESTYLASIKRDIITQSVSIFLLSFSLPWPQHHLSQSAATVSIWPVYAFNIETSSS